MQFNAGILAGSYQRVHYRCAIYGGLLTIRAFLGVECSYASLLLKQYLIVQVCEVQLVGAVVTPALDCPVITAPFVAE